MADPSPAVPTREVFVNAYAGKAPWDTGQPQPAFTAVAGKISGSILDSGCGPGDNALFFAARGNGVTGFDFLEEPIAWAKRKAAERGLSAKFVVKNALHLQDWSERFDNVIDSGLFHVFTDADRATYALGLATVLKPAGRLFLLCFSDATPGTVGPRRVTQAELRATFADGWQIESLEPSQFETRAEARDGMFSGVNPKAWFLVARRTP